MKSALMSQLTARLRKKLPGLEFAFPAQRREPLVDAGHIRSAVARFNQVKGVSDEERTKGWRRILDAAKKFGVDVHDTTWRDLEKPGQ